MFGLEWYDYLFLPWAVSKATWNAIKGQKKPDPGRVPQMSSYGRALSLVYGKTRITHNVLMYDIVSIGGGKFSATAMFALCEGPIAGVARVWVDKDIRGTPGEWGITVSLGTRPTQTVWSVLSGTKAIGYPGVAWAGQYVASAAFIQGSTGQISYEVQGLLHATGDATNGDAHPADILKGSVATPASSMLCEPNFGAGFPFTVEVELGRDGTAGSSYRRYTTAEGFWISPAFTEQKPATEHLAEVLAATNASCLWTSGLLEIVPLGDQSVTGNSVTYTPPTTIQYALTRDDFLAQDDGQLIDVELPASSDVYNIAPVEFLERAPTAASTDPANAYNASIAEDGDPVDVLSVRGEKRAQATTMHAICLRPVALKISRLRAQRSVQARARYRFRLPWRFARLEPLDFVTIEDKLLGLTPPVPVRLDSVEEDPETYALDIEAVEWPFGTGAAVTHTTQSSDGPLHPADAIEEEKRIHEIAISNLAPKTLPAGTYNAVIHTGGLTWVAVGASIAAQTVDNGENWATVTIPAGTYEALAFDGASTVIAVGVNVCARSTDNGATWATQTIPGGTYRAAAWSPALSLFCAVGDTGGSAGLCSTSPTGVTWTTRTIPNGAYWGLAWADLLGLFCAVGLAGVIATTPDGSTWTARTSGTAANLNAVAWNGSTSLSGSWLVAVGGTALRSRDGVNWTAASSISWSGNYAQYSITWTGAIWVAGGHKTISPFDGILATSRDGNGDTWTARALTASPAVGVASVATSGTPPGNGRRTIMVGAGACTAALAI